ncbi:hypothetical protein, partial [Prevotella pectinovora]|uniref:hypothetical protein n=1 Tax=Prevotella pectinovora TaxID=1602169 RepID=UPI00307A550E
FTTLWGRLKAPLTTLISCHQHSLDMTVWVLIILVKVAHIADFQYNQEIFKNCQTIWFFVVAF